jgi:hypothetical protein
MRSIENLAKIGAISLVSATLGWFASQYAHTPQKGLIADVNNDKYQDIVLHARNRKSLVLYGTDTNDISKTTFISGDKASEFFNQNWRNDYEQRYGEKPDYEKLDLESGWN